MLLENFCVNGTADVTFPSATEAEAGAMPEFIGNPHRMRTTGRRAQGRTRLPDSPRARDGTPHVSVLVGNQEHDHCGA